jgi:hypothetical protein
MIEKKLMIQNERDQRVFAWLRERFSDETILKAIEAIPGQRKSFVSNICKQLGVEPPEELGFVSQEEGRVWLKKVKEQIKQKIAK